MRKIDGAWLKAPQTAACTGLMSAFTRGATCCFTGMGVIQFHAAFCIALLVAWANMGHAWISGSDFHCWDGTDGRCTNHRDNIGTAKCVVMRSMRMVGIARIAVCAEASLFFGIDAISKSVEGMVTVIPE